MTNQQKNNMNDKSIKISTLFLLLFISQSISAQLTDLARLEYSFIPKSNSEDQYTRLRALFNYPIKVNEDDYLVVGAEYNRVLLNLEDNYPFNNSLLEKIHIVDINLAYTFKTSEKWRVGLKLTPRLASTLTNKITSKDLFLNGGVYFINDRTKEENLKRPYRLILGLTYNTTTGLPFPLPFVSYFREVNDKWTFTVGVPKSNLKYIFNEKNNAQVFIGLDGYYAHIQRPSILLGKQVDNISLSVALSGFGYEYCFTKHLVAYAYTGYTFRLNNVLRNENRDNIYTLDDVNAFYLRTGFKFKI